MLVGLRFQALGYKAIAHATRARGVGFRVHTGTEDFARMSNSGKWWPRSCYFVSAGAVREAFGLLVCSRSRSSRGGGGGGGGGSGGGGGGGGGSSS